MLHSPTIPKWRTTCSQKPGTAKTCFEKDSSSNWGHYHHHHHHHYLSHQLAYRAATKLLHPCLSLASLWMVPQLWFMFFIFVYTVLRKVFFGWPHFCFPSGVQWMRSFSCSFKHLTWTAKSHSTFSEPQKGQKSVHACAKALSSPEWKITKSSSSHK